MNKSTKPLRILTLHMLVALVCMVGSADLLAAVVCSFNSTALAFAPYDASITGPTDGVGTVSLQCTNQDPSANSGVTIAVGLGTSANGSITDRKMAGNGSLLSYGIYRDAARTSNWGQGMDAMQQSSGPFASNETKQLNFSLFARIPAQQNARAGLYQDQLMLTVSP